MSAARKSQEQHRVLVGHRAFPKIGSNGGYSYGDGASDAIRTLESRESSTNLILGEMRIGRDLGPEGKTIEEHSAMLGRAKNISDLNQFAERMRGSETVLRAEAKEKLQKRTLAEQKRLRDEQEVKEYAAGDWGARIGVRCGKAGSV